MAASAPAPRTPANAVARFHYGEVLYNRGLSEPALDVVEGGDRPEPRLRRGPLPARLRVWRSGPARSRARRDQARGGTESRCWPAPRLIWRFAGGAPGRRGKWRRNGRSGSDPHGPGHPAACPAPRTLSPFPVPRWPTTTSAWPSGRRGYHDDALREYQAGSRCRRGSPAQPAGHGGGASAPPRPRSRRSSSTTPWSSEFPDSPKMWNERGVCLHQAGKRADALASYEKAVAADSALPAGVEQHRRYSGERGFQRTVRRRLSAGAGRRRSHS